MLLPENKHEAKKGHRVIDLAGSRSKKPRVVYTPVPFAVYTENAQGQLKESLWQVCSVNICLLLECPSFEMGAAKKQHSLTH